MTAAENGHTPLGVHSIASIYPANCSAGMPDGSYVRAVAEPYTANRLQAAWWIMTGRAYALVWPESGDLENALGINVRRRTPHVEAATKDAQRSDKRDINSLQNILDKCENEGDRAFFGSTNDYDAFKEIVQRLYASVFFPRAA
ncbi:hypothetical protein FJV76_14410 [Mesorhizobium sp. WSM4303]|uniref:hypothetical protein n=1 Tax=Mesorhizobium sp. WSM4303 TaxID=2589887 RepID=UPI00115D79E0|nr:hypothetical protein [Mesorhizobium sp. WSM4303]TRD03824.1 hypothetical protein FJV76_14410 [Mesorhizobium sp. WSM4303]